MTQSEFTSAEKLGNTNGIDKIQLKGDCVDESIVIRFSQITLYSYSLNKLPGYKTVRNLLIIQFKKVNRSFNFRITINFEVHDKNRKNFTGELKTLTLFSNNVRKIIMFNWREDQNS